MCDPAHEGCRSARHSHTSDIVGVYPCVTGCIVCVVGAVWEIYVTLVIVVRTRCTTYIVGIVMVVMVRVIWARSHGHGWLPPAPTHSPIRTDPYHAHAPYPSLALSLPPPSHVQCSKHDRHAIQTM